MAKTQEKLAPMIASARFRVGEWRVDSATDEISRRGEVIRLEPRTMRLLVRLAQSPHQVVSSQQLLSSVWGDVIVGPASVYQAISQLRKVLGDTGPVPTYIATIPRKGYRLVAPVEEDADGTPSDASPTYVPALSVRSPVQRRVHSGWGVSALIMILVAGGATYLSVRDPPPAQMSHTQTATLDSRTIAVLPLVAAAHDQATRRLAPIVTDLLRTRLAAVRNLIVISEASSKQAVQENESMVDIATELDARYLLQGEVTQIGDRVRLDISLLDAQTSVPVWSKRFDRPIVDLAAVNNEVLREIARTLQVAIDQESGTSASANAPLNLAAYELYLRGRQLMSTYRAEDAKEASIIFSRVTTLDPKFARGYLGYGEALLLAADLGAWVMNDELASRARKAFDRALELNPALGEAWAQRARLTVDPVAAEEMYRRAVQLAPGHDETYIRYNDFLFAQRRRGEALELVDHARRIDPLSAALCVNKAVLLLATYGDVDGMQRLLREALAINPDFPTALSFLGAYGALFTGEFAEGIRLLERASAVDRNRNDYTALYFYLDVGDPFAATAMVRDDPRHLGARFGQIAIAQYHNDVEQAAALSSEIYAELLAEASAAESIRNDQRTYAAYDESIGVYSHPANALRDRAIATGDYATALDLIGRRFEFASGSSLMRARGLVLTYAHTLLLAGETRRGRELLHSLLEHLDTEEIGRPEHWFSWERAAALAMLGEDEKALQQLAASVESRRFAGWWYTAERDPVYARIRHDPRFQALVVETAAQRKQQLALLDEMRRKGEVPVRR